jgi:hypothetical protein
MSCVNNGQLGVVGPSAIISPGGSAPPVTFFLQLAGGAGYILLAGSADHIVLAGH